MNVVVILAAGNGTRMKTRSIKKQHIKIEEKQILEYTINAFSVCDDIDDIIIVSNMITFEKDKSLISKYKKVRDVIVGGDTRIESVKRSVEYLAKQYDEDDKIIFSDAVRPCITKEEISGIINSLKTYIACTTVIDLYETIFKLEDNELESVLSRDNLVRQTSPEGYILKVLKMLYLETSQEIIEKYNNIGIDQLHRLGCGIGLVKSTPLNFKITTPEDLELFKAIIKSKDLNKYNF